VFVENRGAGNVLRYKSRKDDLFWLESNVFPGTLWISREYLVEAAKAKEDPAKKGSVQANEGVAHYRMKDQVTLEAWVRVADGRPIKVSLPNMIYEYGPIEPFQGPIALPAAVSAARKDMQKKQAVLRAVQQANSRQNK